MRVLVHAHTNAKQFHACTRTSNRFACVGFAASLRKISFFLFTSADKHFLVILSFPKNDKKVSYLCKQTKERAFLSPKICSATYLRVNPEFNFYNINLRVRPIGEYIRYINFELINTENIRIH